MSSRAVLVVLLVALIGAVAWTRDARDPARAVDGATCQGPVAREPLPTHPVVAFGDSIALGYGASQRCQGLEVRAALPLAAHRPHSGDTTYPAVLSQLWGETVLDEGVRGEMAAQGADRLPIVLRASHPRRVLILEGVNDLRRGVLPERVLRSLETMVDSTRRAGATPVLLTLLPVAGPERRWSGRVAALNQLMRIWASGHHVRLIDLAAVFPSGGLSPDGLHPTDAGYRLMAHLVVAESVRGW